MKLPDAEPGPRKHGFTPSIVQEGISDDEEGTRLCDQKCYSNMQAGF